MPQTRVPMSSMDSGVVSPPTSDIVCERMLGRVILRQKTAKPMNAEMTFGLSSTRLRLMFCRP